MKTNKKTVAAAVAFAVLLLVGSFTGVLAGFLLSGKMDKSEKAVVSDAMCETVEEYGVTHCYHIPQVNSEVEGIADVNSEIYDTLYEIYAGGVGASQKKYGFINLGSMVYTYTQKDNTVSIVVQTQDNRSEEYDYYVFNVDTENGTLMTKDEICSVFGKDENSFNAEVRTAISRYSEREKAKYPETEIEKYINPIIERTLSTEYINAAAPFISEDGELSAVVSLFSSGGKDTYHHLFDIETATDKGTLESCKNHISIAGQSSQSANTTPEVSYVYIQGEEKKTERAEEEKTTKPEKTTEAEETTRASSESKKPSSGSKTLTKDVLMSNSWYGVAQWEWELIFLADGTVEVYGAGYDKENYSIDGNFLYVGGRTFEYISLNSSDVWKDDEFFVNGKAEELDPDEMFFYGIDSNFPWLIDATGRYEADKAYCFYRNFSMDEYEDKWHNNDEYIHTGFEMIDVDEDGTDELIVHEGTCEQDRKYHFYTYKNKEIIYLGSIGAWHASLCDNDGYLIKYAGMTGEGDYFRVTIENGKVTETKEGTYTFPPIPDFGDKIEFWPSLY